MPTSNTVSVGGLVSQSRLSATQVVLQLALVGRPAALQTNLSSIADQTLKAGLQRCMAGVSGFKHTSSLVPLCLLPGPANLASGIFSCVSAGCLQLWICRLPSAVDVQVVFSYGSAGCSDNRCCRLASASLAMQRSLDAESCLHL